MAHDLPVVSVLLHASQRDRGPGVLPSQNLGDLGSHVRLDSLRKYVE